MAASAKPTPLVALTTPMTAPSKSDDLSPHEFYETLARKAGAAAARTHEATLQKTDALLSEFKGRMLELELSAVRLQSDLRERLAEIHDGAQGEQGPAGEPGPQGERGLDGSPGDQGPQGERGFGLDDFDTELVEDGKTLLFKFVRGDTTEVHEIPLPQGPAGTNGLDGMNGKDGAPGERGMDGRDGLSGRDGLPGLPGERGIDGVNGEQGPQGERGLDGQGFEVRGLWEEEGVYQQGDIVALNGGSFVALQDAPGECPGPGWQMWARQGKPGQKGDRGERGERGPPGITTRLVGGRVDAEKMELILVQNDGEALTIDLYPVAEVIKASM